MSLLDCVVVYCDILCGKSSILVIYLCSVLYTLPFVYFINDSDSSQLYSAMPLKNIIYSISVFKSFILLKWVIRGGFC